MVREKSRAKSKPTQARRRILYVQTGIDFHRLMCEPCCATQQNQALDFRFRVKSGHCAVSGRCLLYPQKRTLIERVRMSALCQKRTLNVVSHRPYPEPSPGTGMIRGHT